MGARKIKIDSLDDEMLRRLWLFRLRHMDLKPGISLEDDYILFVTDLRRFSFLWIEEDEQGDLLNSVVGASGIIEYEGRRIQWVGADYGYKASKHRSYPLSFFFCFIYFMMRKLRHPWLPTYFAGPSYLPSFLSGLTGISRFWTVSQQSDVPSFEARLQLHLAAHLCGESLEPITGLVHMRTLPQDRRTRSPRHPETLALYKRYMSENPRWIDGYCVFVLLPINLRWLFEMWALVVKRMYRRSL